MVLSMVLPSSFPQTRDRESMVLPSSLPHRTRDRESMALPSSLPRGARSCAVAVACTVLHLQLLLAPVACLDYVAYTSKNTFTGHGSVNIDTSGTSSPPRNGVNASACQAWCTQTDCCDCVVFAVYHPTKHGTCYRRQACEPRHFVSTKTPGMDVYVKSTPAKPCPTPHPTPDPPAPPPVPYVHPAPPPPHPPPPPPGPTTYSVCTVW